MNLKENDAKKAVEILGTTMADSEMNQLEGKFAELPVDTFSVKNMMGLSDSMLESMYGQAYTLYNTGKYKDAKHLFKLLVMASPQDPKFILGLAGCHHMLKNYVEALNVYMMCSVADPSSPLPHYHSSDCYLKINEKISALVALEMAVKNAKDLPAFKGLKDRALLTIETLKKELKIKS